MSDSQKINQIRRLNRTINRLKKLVYSVYGLNFTQFKAAGSKNWSGKVKSSQFNERYQQASKQLRMVAPEIEEAISICRRKMYRLAWSIDDPGKKVQALAIVTFS